jgi:hypothetical protein
MTAPRDNDADGSTRIVGDDATTGRHGRTDAPASGTRSGADVHDRMTGTDRDRHESVEERHVPAKTKPAKTSAAAAFGLVFGLAALFSALTAILAPAAVVFGIIGIIVSIAGMKMAKRLGVTGKGVAIGGLVTSILGLLLGGAVLAGAAVLVNDPAQLDRLQTEINNLLEDAPSTSQISENVPG